MVNGVLDKDDVRRNHECVQKHQELLTLSAKYVAFAARRDPRCTTKNILVLTITGKPQHLPSIPDALVAASIPTGCVLFLRARLREIFGGNDRERREYIGGDMAIVREVDAQLNDLNKAFPVMAKAWESKLPAINMYAISVAPRGEDRAKETANRLMWESFIVIQDNQATDVQQKRAFINNLMYSKDDAKKFIDEDFGEEETPAHVAPQSKAMPRSSAGSEQQGVPPSASSSSGTTGRAPWWTSNQPAGKERDDGLVVNQTIQAILEISAKGEDDRRAMPERHDANESYTIIEQCTAFSNLRIGVSFVAHRKSGVVMPATKFGPEVKASYWERYLRHLVTTLLIFDERRRADRIITAYLNKPNLAWLQLYAYICAKTGVSLFGKVARSDALKALIDGMTIPTRPMLEVQRSSRGTTTGEKLNSLASNCAMLRRQPSPT